jgi:hypothetical protein
VNQLDLDGTRMGRHQAAWCFSRLYICGGAFAASRLANRKAASLRKKHGLNPQQENALQHSYWMALVTRYYGAKAARSLGRAHERDGGNGREDTEKDFMNNERGILVGRYAYREKDIESILLYDVQHGYLKCLNGQRAIVPCGS